MNRVEMRSLFLDCLGHVADDLDGAVIDSYLQKVYRFEIPNKIGEASDDSYFDLTPTGGIDLYPFTLSYFANCRSITGPVYVMSSTPSDVEVFTDVKTFYSRYPTSTDGTPLGVLVRGRKVRFRPVPVDLTVIRLYGNAFRAEFGEDGVEDFEAWAVVHGAVALRCLHTGRDDLKAQFDAEYKLSLAEVASMYASGVRKSAPPGDIW